MFSLRAVRHSSRSIRLRTPRGSCATSRPQYHIRPFSNATRLHEDSPESGTHSRTDKEIVIENPTEKALPKTTLVKDSVNNKYMRTLASFSLEGNVAVITGGARGLGLVIAQGLVLSGADVALVDLNKDEAARQAKILMQHFKEDNPESEHMPRITAHYADVSDESSVEGTIAEILKEHGKIDNLVTSAGFVENFDAIDYPYNRVKKLWGVNVDGTYLFAREVGKHLMERKSKGSIVMIGSMSAVAVNVPQPQAPYNASKAAVRQLAASLAVEWAHAGIRVNCISPGYMLTALTQKIMDEGPELRAKWLSLIPNGQMGNPRDLMGPVTFLLSDASGYVTGADLRVDGGYTLT